MGRPSHSRALAVWMNGKRVGTWTLPTRGPQVLHYADSWLHSDKFRPLSLSLPGGLGNTALQGAAVESWFENLLPDSGDIRRRVQRRFQAASTSAFDLLAAVGRDCAGAVQLLPVDDVPSGLDRIEATQLSEQDIGRLLRGVVAPSLPGSSGQAAEELRLSVAGSQEKTALLRHDGHWCRPLRGTPTTHLFKLPMGAVGNGQIDFSSSVENEWLCGRLLRGYGLQVAASEIASFEGQRCLIVERFDRRRHPTGSYWLRLPTEDFCQATATPPEQKYENQGGPGMVAISELLAQSSAVEDRRTFYSAQVLYWMLRAIDGHAKNFSLFLNPGGRYQLTPLYDVLSAWPVIGSGAGQWPQQEIRMAMAWQGTKGSTYKPLKIQRRHLISTARRLGLGAVAESSVDGLVEKTPAVIEAVKAELPSAFPEALAEAVFQGLQSSADQIASQKQ